jgi:hypothetical protein
MGCPHREAHGMQADSASIMRADQESNGHDLHLNGNDLSALI